MLKLMSSRYNISFSDFLRWNPELNTGCTSAYLREGHVGRMLTVRVRPSLSGIYEPSVNLQ